MSNARMREHFESLHELIAERRSELHGKSRDELLEARASTVETAEVVSTILEDAIEQIQLFSETASRVCSAMKDLNALLKEIDEKS